VDYKPRIKVLIAEDDPMVSEMIRGLLEDLSFTVVGEALDGQEAVELTQTMLPDVVLMDIQMPGLTGLEASRHITQLALAPIVILTAYETPKLLAEASDVGVGAYLVKPPQPQELERAIAIAIARFKDMVELRRMNDELQTALARVKRLSGLLPICASCKKIRDDGGYWQQVEVYIRDHADVEFSHGLCPDCAHRLYPDFFE
jgi:AmiR/NasT family two-component response regulator